jgi:hypothetical protein
MVQKLEKNGMFLYQDNVHLSHAPGGHQQTEYITNENQNFYAADHARIEFNLGKL